MAQETELSFEAAYERLETILETMNSGKVSLEESLKLYEEADGLIVSSTKRLDEAEKRIKTLVKNREGDLLLDEQGSPLTQDFVTGNAAPLHRDLHG